MVIFTESVEKIEKHLKNLIKKAANLLNIAKEFVLLHKTAARITLASVIFVAALAVSLNVSGVSVGVKVLYNGDNTGIIETTDVFSSAKRIAVSSVEGAKECDFCFDNFTLQKVLTLKSRMTSAREVAKVIVSSNADVVSATEILVNGERKAYINNFDVDAYISSRLSAYDVEGAQNTHEFMSDVQIKNCYCLTSDLAEVSAVTDLIDSLDVKTTSVIISEESVPFSTVTEKTSMQYVGYSSVITSGVNGILAKTENIISVNGVAISSEEVSNTIISEPVDEVVLVGTKKMESSSAKKMGFIFPLPKGSYVLTSYYGDGRNHRGVDLGADKGTSIYAVKSGTVTFSGSNGNYGYCVIVDHGNGLKTLYAHANKLLVSEGEKVEAGQVLATVGNTGRSTGNHLHFEVIVNGSNVNPAPYIGIS